VYKKHREDIMKKRVSWYIFSIIAVVLVSGITFGSAAYGKKVLSPNENVSLWVAFPTGNITKPVTLANPAGGKVFVKPVVIDISKQGVLKKLFNHWMVGMSTHWVVNVGNTTEKVALKFSGPDIPIEWEIRSGFKFDETTKSFEQALSPGQQVPNLVMDWIFTIPEELRSQSVLYQGALVVSNAQTGRELSKIPVKIINGGIK
jgi:hypothetical protein